MCSSDLHTRGRALFKTKLSRVFWGSRAPSGHRQRSGAEARRGRGGAGQETQRQEKEQAGGHVPRLPTGTSSRTSVSGEHVAGAPRPQTQVPSPFHDLLLSSHHSRRLQEAFFGKTLMDLSKKAVMVPPGQRHGLGLQRPPPPTQPGPRPLVPEGKTTGTYYRLDVMFVQT